MATTSKNLNIGSWRTLGAFAPSFAGGTDFVAVVTPLLGSLSSQGMDCSAMGDEDILGGYGMDNVIPGSPEGRPEANLRHQSNYQTEYGPPIVSFRDALKRIPK